MEPTPSPPEDGAVQPDAPATRRPKRQRSRSLGGWVSRSLGMLWRLGIAVPISGALFLLTAPDTVSGPTALGAQASRLAADQGQPLRIERLRLDGLGFVADGVAYGSLQAERIQMRAQWVDLEELPVILSLHLTRPSGLIQVDQTGALSLMGVDLSPSQPMPSEPAAEAPPLALPTIESLRVDGGALTLLTPEGPVVATLDASGQVKGQGISAAGTLRLIHDTGRAYLSGAVTLDGQGSLRNLALDGTVRLPEIAPLAILAGLPGVRGALALDARLRSDGTRVLGDAELGLIVSGEGGLLEAGSLQGRFAVTGRLGERAAVSVSLPQPLGVRAVLSPAGLALLGPEMANLSQSGAISAALHPVGSAPIALIGVEAGQLSAQVGLGLEAEAFGGRLSLPHVGISSRSAGGWRAALVGPVSLAVPGAILAPLLPPEWDVGAAETVSVRLGQDKPLAEALLDDEAEITLRGSGPMAVAAGDVSLFSAEAVGVVQEPGGAARLQMTGARLPRVPGLERGSLTLGAGQVVLTKFGLAGVAQGVTLEGLAIPGLDAAVDARFQRASLTDLPQGGRLAALEAAHLTTRMDGSLVALGPVSATLSQASDGTGQVTFAAEGRLNPAGRQGTAVQITADGTALLTPDTITASPALCISAQGLPVEEGRTRQCPSVTLTHQRQSGRSTLALTLASQRLALAPALPGAQLSLPVTALTLVTEPGSAPSLSLSAPGVDLRLADPPLSLTGLTLRAEMTPAVDLRLTQGRLTHRDDPAWFVPLSLTARLRAPTLGAPLSVSLRAEGVDRALIVEANGSLDAATGSGQVDWTIFEILFEPAVRTLDQVSPLLSGMVTTLTGRFSATGRIRLQRWVPRVSTRLTVMDMGLVRNALTASGINGTVAIDSLSPLKVTIPQTVTLGLIDVGVPLTGGRLTFRVDGNDIALDEARFAWLGGLVLGGGAQLNIARQTSTLTLRAQNLSLTQLLQEVDVPGLTGDGLVNGSLPIRWEDNRLQVVDGVLRATDGVLRYQPQQGASPFAGAGAQAQLVEEALRHLNYKELVIRLNGQEGAAQQITLAVDGSNPDFQRGRPVRLTVNLEGALDRLLQNAIDSQSVGRLIERSREGQ